MLYKQVSENKKKTIVLMILFTMIVLATGSAIGYIFYGNLLLGLVISAIVMVIYLPFTFYSSKSQVIRMSGAKLADENTYSELHNIVEELSIAARLPKPEVYVIQDDAANAFATGTTPEKSAVAFTTGILDTLNREELSGVVAHELAHIRNYDIRLMTICIALVSIIVIMSDIAIRMMFYGGSRNRKTHPVILIVALIFIILSPMVVQMVRFAVSRNREYLADATAVEMTRNPLGLKNALLKISKNPKEVDKAKDATASMYIVRPLRRKRKGKRRKKRSLLATHPPIESRIERLDNM